MGKVLENGGGIEEDEEANVSKQHGHLH